MKLTDLEKTELNSLLERQKSRTIPMMQRDFERLTYLSRKEFHNCCSNPQCEGYDALETEMICPKCGKSIFKTI